MSKFHDDIYLWNTINDVLWNKEDSVKEKIYSELYGKTWRISDIERLAISVRG